MPHFKILLQPAKEGGYTMSVPALPGCITEGETIDEAITMAREAIELYVQELKERGETVPDDNNTLEYSITLPLAS